MKNKIVLFKKYNKFNNVDNYLIFDYNNMYVYLYSKKM